MKVVPSNAAGHTLVSGIGGSSSGWDEKFGTWGAWVEFFSSTPADLYIAGVVVTHLKLVEIEIGIGASGSEVGFSRFRVFCENAGNVGPRLWMFPAPIAGILSGQRISARVRSSLGDVGLNLMYFEGGVTGSTNISTSKLHVLPDTTTPVTAGAIITVGTTAWVNTAWTEIDGASSIAFGLAGIGIAYDGGTSEEWEIDVGIGASGSEAVIATARFQYADDLFIAAEQQPIVWLPGAYPIDMGTRVAVRGRFGGTVAETLLVHLYVWAPRLSVSAGPDQTITWPTACVQLAGTVVES
jgi:hypothetical protein